MTQNLLVVDWDYFFRNPGMRLEQDAKETFLYDWGSGENGHQERFFPGLWEQRASAFLRAGKPLPRCVGWEDFWDRFHIDEYASAVAQDSNYYAAEMMPEAGHWDRIDLYDAHHDSGYGNGGGIHCGNWTLAHYRLGTAIHVHYPPWRDAIDGIEKGPEIPVERSIDTGGQVDTVYDGVFVCRSGAWVPPWNDTDFLDFLDRAPVPIYVMDSSLAERPFDISFAERSAETWTRLLADRINGI